MSFNFLKKYLKPISDHRASGYKVSVHSTWAKTSLETPLLYWSHFCFTFEHKIEKWQIYQDGEFADEGTLPPYDGPLDPNGAYVIGNLPH